MNFESLIYQLPGHVYWFDQNQVLRGSNDEQARSFGLKSASDLIGRSLSDFFSPELFKAISLNNKKVMESGKGETFFEPFQYPNGTKSTFLSKKIPLLNSDNQVVGLLGVSFDFTAEKNAEEQRRKMLDSLIALMPGHVYWKNTQGQFLGCNETQAETVGLTREEMIGKTDWEMPWHMIAPKLRQNDLEVMRTKLPLTIDEDAVVDGVYCQYLSKKVPLVDGQNEVIGILGVSFDVTDQRRSEELKLQMRIANERADSMKVMASSIAHELRTPLSAIHSAMGWVNEEMPKLLAAYEAAQSAGLDIPQIHPRRIGLFDQICADVSHEAESANNIINMLLMKLGQTNLSTQDLEICSITECIYESLKRYPFPTEDHRKLVHFDPKEPVVDFQFKGSSLLLNHVLFNLLKNSLHFIDEVNKGEISIYLRQDNNIENILIFRDTAKGISEKDLPSVFEKFFSKTLHGTGIGLAFCKQVMHSFGGTISCQSVEGEFTEFILGFPKIRKGSRNNEK